MLLVKGLNRIRKKSMFFDSKVTQVERLRSSFNNFGKGSSQARKEFATKKMKNGGKTLGVGAKNGSATVSKNLKSALSTTPDVTNFYRTEEGL